MGVLDTYTLVRIFIGSAPVLGWISMSCLIWDGPWTMDGYNPGWRKEGRVEGFRLGRVHAPLRRAHTRKTFSQINTLS